MRENKEVKISYMAAHLTTIVSVTLVLLLLGIIAMIWTGAHNETRRLKERIELSVVLADSISDGQADLICGQIKKMPFANDAKVITRDQAMAQWAEDTGENLETLFGVNPLSPEISFSLKSDYATPASIKNIEKQLRAVPGVEDVAMPDLEMVDSMNRNIGNLTLILAIVAAVMVVISFVLINNTVRLTVYSRRFSIHTMQLVGATNGFIRRPFVVNNLMSGVVAGLLASGILALFLLLTPKAGIADLNSLIPWPTFAIIAAGLVLAGALVCLLAAWLAICRYLRMDYDELFK